MGVRVDKLDVSKCSSCGACEKACPVNAVIMLSDWEGVNRPVVDERVCTDCGVCESICPAQSGAVRAEKPLKVYGVKHREKNIHETSVSGGAAYGLSKDVLDRGGVVFGAAFLRDNSVAHIEVRSIDELYRLQGSKYVQSDLGDTYIKIKAALDGGDEVLFSGTPCQCAGLRNFLGRDYEKLLIVDVLCMSAPTPALWRDFLSFAKKHYGGNIESARFRENGEAETIESVVIEGERKYSTWYGRLFYTHAFSLPSCGECPYHSISRVGDISLGDFVGVETHYPEFNERDGVSIMLISTEKGTAAFERVREHFDIMEPGEGTYDQPALREGNYSNPDRDSWWETYRRGGFEALVKRIDE